MFEPTLYAKLVGIQGEFVDADFEADDFNLGTYTAELHPVLGREGSSLPLVSYYVQDTESVWTLRGPTGRLWYVVNLDVWAINEARARETAQALIDGLETWHSDGVITCLFLSAEPNEETAGYHMTLTFRILFNNADT